MKSLIVLLSFLPLICLSEDAKDIREKNLKALEKAGMKIYRGNTPVDITKPYAENKKDNNQIVVCPQGTTKVDYTSKFSNERKVFCQKSHNGKYVKHGPFIKYNSKGEILEEKYFSYDVETTCEPKL